MRRTMSAPTQKTPNAPTPVATGTTTGRFSWRARFSIQPRCSGPESRLPTTQVAAVEKVRA
jgi:hypothetical protein